MILEQFFQLGCKFFQILFVINVLTCNFVKLLFWIITTLIYTIIFNLTILHIHSTAFKTTKLKTFNPFLISFRTIKLQEQFYLFSSLWEYKNQHLLNMDEITYLFAKKIANSRLPDGTMLI